MRFVGWHPLQSQGSQRQQENSDTVLRYTHPLIRKTISESASLHDLLLCSHVVTLVLSPSEHLTDFVRAVCVPFRCLHAPLIALSPSSFFLLSCLTLFVGIGASSPAKQMHTLMSHRCLLSSLTMSLSSVLFAYLLHSSCSSYPGEIGTSLTQ